MVVTPTSSNAVLGPPKRIGAAYARMRSTAPARRKAPARVGPPSNRTSVRSASARRTSSGFRVRNRRVGQSLLSTRDSGGMSRSPTTTRSGCLSASRPSGSRAVRLGSSASTVPVPTTIASAAARRRCTSARAAALVIHCEDPSAAALLPSMLAANFQVTCGRPVRCRCNHSRSGPLVASAAATPAVTSTPAAVSRFAPPAAVGLGSPAANTTAETPAANKASTHGGVRP